MGNRFYLFGTADSRGYEAGKTSVWHQLDCNKGLDYVVGAVMIDSADEINRDRFAIVSTRTRVLRSFDVLFSHMVRVIWQSNDPLYIGLRLAGTAPQDSDEFHLVRGLFSLFHPMQYQSFLDLLANCPVDVTHFQLLCDEPVTEGDCLSQCDAEKQFDTLIRNARDYATAFRRIVTHDWNWFENWRPLHHTDSTSGGGMLWAALNGRAAFWEHYLCMTDSVDGTDDEIRACWWEFVNLEGDHYIDWRRADDPSHD